MGLLQGLGQAQPVTQFINTAGQYQTTQSNLETQRLQQQMLQQQAQQLEKDNKEYHIDAALSLYSEPDRPFIKQVLTTAGKIRPDGTVIGKDMREVPKLFEAYPKIAIGKGQMEYESLASENDKLSKKGDAESQQKMLSNATRMTEIKKHIASLSGKDEADKSFTLGAGQKRFDAQGKEIAAVEKEVKVKDNYVLPSGDSVTLMDNGTFLNEDGSPYEGDRSVLRKVGAKGDTEGVDPSVVRTFEAVHPELVSKRGTTEYGEALQRFIQSGERPYSTFVGTTEDGKSGITFDARKGTFGVQPLPGGGNLQPKISPTIPTEQTTAFQQIGTLKEALGQVTDLYDESFVGPVAGPAGKIADNWGVMPNAKRAEFRALTANLYNTIIYLRSGKQINEEEAKRLMDELPTMNISPTGFQAKLKKFTWELNSIERGKLRQLKGAGYRNVGEPQGQPATAPSAGPVKVWDPATKSFKVQ